MKEPLLKTEPDNPDEHPVSGKLPRDLLIDILGDKFYIATSEDQEYLEEVLGQYRFAIANTQNISGIENPLRIAILTGFLLCDQINKMKTQVREDQANADAQRADEEHELHQITNNLIIRLDSIIEKEPPFDG